MVIILPNLLNHDSDDELLFSQDLKAINESENRPTDGLGWEEVLAIGSHHVDSLS